MYIFNLIQTTLEKPTIKPIHYKNRFKKNRIILFTFILNAFTAIKCNKKPSEWENLIDCKVIFSKLFQ